MVLTGYVIYYMGSSMPFYEPKRDKQEIFNETTVLMASYALLVFTGWIADVYLQLWVGWYLIGCICFNILVNLLIFCYETCKLTAKSVKIWRFKRKVRKL